MSASRSHRHFVVAPLCAMVVALTLWGALRAGAVLPATVPGTLWPEGTDGVLDEGAVAHLEGQEVVLDEGGSLISASALLQIRLGSVTIKGFHGALHVTRNHGTIGVAALTSPALVVHHELKFLIPAGFQGQFDEALLPQAVQAEWIAQSLGALTVVPPSFIEESTKKLDADSPSVSLLPTDPAPKLPSILASLAQLPLARERAVRDERLALADLLTQAVEGKQQTTVSQILRLADGGRAFRASAIGQKAFLALLGSVSEAPTLPLPLLLSLSDQDLLLLLSIHPSTRLAAWSVPMRHPEDTLVRLLTLPLSDLQAEGAPAFIAERWEYAARESIQAAADPEATFETLLNACEPFRLHALRREYPERLQRFAAALLRIHDQAGGAPVLLNSWKGLALFVPSPLPPVTSAPVESDEVMASSSSFAGSIANAEQMKEEVKALLGSAGAVLTLQTTITPVDDQSVAVSGVLFAGKDTDHLYSFTVTLPEHQIKTIVRDGKKLPFPLEWEKFTAWVGQ